MKQEVISGVFQAHEAAGFQQPAYVAEIHDHTVLYMANAPQPIETQVIRGGDGADIEYPISGYVTIDGRQLWITTRLTEDAEDPDMPEAITALEVERDESGIARVVSRRQINPQQDETLYHNPETGSELTLSRVDNDVDRCRGQWRFNYSGKSGARIAVAEASNPHKEKQRKMSWGRKLAVGAMALMAFGPIVTNTVDEVQKINPYYSAAADTRSMLSGTDAYPSSIEMVTGLMGDLHRGDKAAILSAAREYQHKYPDDVVTPEERDQYIEDLDKQQTNPAVFDTLSKFMDIYGKDVFAHAQHGSADQLGSFSSNTPVEETKEVARAAINALSVMPKSIIENANFDALEIGNSMAGILGGEGGVNMTVREGPAKHRRIIGLATDPQGYPQKITSGIQMNIGNKVIGNSSKEWETLHELGHATQDVEKNSQAKSGGIRGGVDFILGKWVDSPEYTSGYAAAAPDEGESDADVMAGAASPNVFDSSGLADPNAYVSFHSGANEKVLNKLTRIEDMSHGGGSAWVVAHNKRLMGKDAL